MATDIIDTSDTSEVFADTVPKVHIRFFGSIRVAAQKSSDDLDLPPDTTVYKLMQTLSEIYGKDLHDELIDNNGTGGLRDDLMITLNEVIINHEKVHELKINGNDIVALFPTFPGGG